MIRFEIHGDNLTITDAIRNYIEDKIGKLERYFNDVPNAVAHVKVKRIKILQLKSVTIPLKNVTLERHDDLYAGIDLVTSKLERQVRKYKTRVNRKHKTHGEPEAFVAEVQEAPPETVDDVNAEPTNDSEIEIIRSKQFSLKPMDSEEAVLQMELLGHDFYIFTDRETDGTSIVYKRKDGKYGLIETTE